MTFMAPNYLFVAPITKSLSSLLVVAPSCEGRQGENGEEREERERERGRERGGK